MHFFSTWIDDLSNYCITHRTQFDVPIIKSLHTDRGGEYTGDVFEKHLSERGTAHMMPAHDSSAQNGKAERKNRTLLDDARSMIAGASDLPKSLWVDAVSYSTWLRNRLVPSGALDVRVGCGTKLARS